MKTITIIIGMVLLLSVVSAEVISIEPEVLDNISLYGGESITQNITIKTDGNYLVFLSWNVEGNSSDMVGFNVNLPESIFVEEVKTIPITISVLSNFNPDSFTINFTASTEKSEEIIKVFVPDQITELETEEFNLSLDINSTGVGDVTVVTFETNPEKSFSIPSLNIFFDINVSDSINENMAETEIRVSYTDEEVSALGIQESTLRLHFFNKTLNDWQEQEGGVNTTGNYVYAFTDHFSLWGLFGNAIPAPTSSSSSSSSSSGSGNYRRTIVTTNVTNESEVDEENIGEGVEEVDESTEDESTEDESIVDKGRSLITGAVTGLEIKNQNYIRVIGVVFIGLILSLFFIFEGGLPFTSYFKRAAVFHKRAQRAHLKGKYQKSNELYNKSYLLREKGEGRSFE